MDWKEVRKCIVYAAWTLFVSLFTVISFVTLFFHLAFLGGSIFSLSFMPVFTTFVLAMYLVVSAYVGKVLASYLIGVVLSTVFLKRRIKSYVIWALSAVCVGGLMRYFPYWSRGGELELILCLPVAFIVGMLMCFFARIYYSKNLE